MNHQLQPATKRNAFIWLTWLSGILLLLLLFWMVKWHLIILLQLRFSVIYFFKWFIMNSSNWNLLHDCMRRHLMLYIILFECCFINFPPWCIQMGRHWLTSKWGHGCQGFIMFILLILRLANLSSLLFVALIFFSLNFGMILFPFKMNVATGNCQLSHFDICSINLGNIDYCLLDFMLYWAYYRCVCWQVTKQQLTFIVKLIYTCMCVGQETDLCLQRNNSTSILLPSS